MRPEIPPDLERVLHRTLMRDPAQRWPDAASLARALAAISTGRPVPAEPSPVAPSTAPITDGPALSHLAAAAVDAGPPDNVAPAPSPSGPPAEPAPTSSGPPPAEAAPPATRTGRRTLVVVASVVAVIAVVGIVGLAWRAFGPGGDEAVAATATAFDPFAGDGENDSTAPLVTDGDAATSWSTERYDDRVIYKGGVGLLLDGGEQRSFASLAVDSESTGWAAEVYVLDGEPVADQDSWGDAVASAADIDGDAAFDLAGRSGRFILLWITQTDEDGLVEINEARIEGEP
jgi:serine/threonine-protein kinase